MGRKGGCLWWLVVGCAIAGGVVYLLCGGWRDKTKADDIGGGSLAHGTGALLASPDCKGAGTVLDPWGEPVAAELFGTVVIEGVAVTRFDSSTWSYIGRTGADGRYAVLTRAGELHLWARASGYAPSEVYVGQPRQGRALGCPPLRLKAGGRLIVSLDKSMFSSDTPFLLSVTGDRNKYFEERQVVGGEEVEFFGVPKQGVHISLFSQEDLGGLERIMGRSTIIGPAGRRRVVLGEESPAVKGWAVSLSVPASMFPCLISLVNRFGGQSASVHCLANGEYVIRGVPAGPCDVFVEAYMSGVTVSDMVDLGVGAKKRALLEYAYGRLVGRVIGNGGDLAERVAVHVQGRAKGTASVEWTGMLSARGDFEVELPEGTYYVWADSEQGYFRRLSWEGQEVRSGATTVLAPRVVGKGGRVVGRAADSSGVMAQGITVCLDAAGESRVRVIESGPHGRFAFSGVSPGVARVWVGRTDKDASSAIYVNVREGETTPRIYLR